MLKSFEQLERRVGCGPSRRVVAVAAGDDLRTLRALDRAERQGILKYRIAGEREKILRAAERAGICFSEDRALYVRSETEAAQGAVFLIKSGKADFLMKGNLHTAILLKAVLAKENGLRGNGLLSHAALLEVPACRKLLCVTDGGMVPHPTCEEKAVILQNALSLFHRLGYGCPKAACLSASETCSERLPESLDAVQLTAWCREGRFGQCIVDGPLSLDLAIHRKACLRKRFHTPTAGDADILLVPDVTSGNLLSKALVTGGAKMAGCVLGAKIPIALSSRAASSYEKYYSLLLACAAAEGVKGGSQGGFVRHFSGEPRINNDKVCGLPQ